MARSKRCVGPCGLTKVLSEFYARRKGQSARQSYCKACHRVYVRKWDRTNYWKRAESDRARQRARYQIPAVGEARKESARAYYRRMKECA